MRMNLTLSRLTFFVSIFALAAHVAPVIAQGDSKSITKTTGSPKAEPEQKSTDDDQKIASGKNRNSDLPKADAFSVDEKAIRLTDASFAEAYTRGDAKSVASLFTDEAEYVDDAGNVSLGRKAIEESLAEFFAANPNCKLEMNIESIRFIGPDVAIEDGSTIVTCQDGASSVDCWYTTVHVKKDGKWYAASVRDRIPKNSQQQSSQLEQLDWLLGDWVNESDDSIVNFSCEPVDHGNYLLRKFKILIAGEEAMSGTERIGWDPLTGRLRTWIFDSEGGYSEGFWHHNGENWMLKATGVTAGGQTASSTSIYTLVNNHTMNWQSVGREIDGVEQPDSEVFEIVRQAPVPTTMVAGEGK